METAIQKKTASRQETNGHLLAHQVSFTFFSNWLADNSLTQKAYLNAIASAIDYGARLVVGFIVNPLLVAGLGSYLYGTWQVLSRLTGYISAASGRPTQALKWTIASKQSSTDFEEKRRQVSSAVIVGLIFFPILAAIGGLFVWFIPALLTIPMEFSSEVRLAAALLVANLIFFNLVEIPQSVLRGENLGYKRMGLSAILVLTGGALIALALYLNTGIAGVATANLITTLLAGALFLQIVRQYVPWFGMIKPLLTEVRRYFRLSWWFMGWRIVKQLMRASDVVLLGILGSAEIVTIYTLTKYVPETLINLIFIVVGGVTPGLGGIIGSGKLRKASAIRGEMMAGTWLLGSVVGVTVLLWNQSFVTLWVGQEHYAGAVPTLLIMIMTIQFVLIQNDAMIIDLTLNLRHKVIFGAISTIVSLLFASALVSLFNLGIMGVCLGFIVGRSILSLGYPYLVGRYLNCSFGSQLGSLLRPMLVTVLLFVAAANLEGGLKAATWSRLIISVAITLVAVTIPTFYAGLSIAQRNVLLSRLTRLKGHFISN